MITTIRAQIEHGAALAFFASAWADMVEEKGRSLRGEIMNQIPDDIDPAALREAEVLMNKMGEINRDNPRCLDNTGCCTVTSIYEYVALLQKQEVRYDRDLTPELFGHYCAMQYMGHGVGLESFGELTRCMVKVPYGESVCLDQDYE